MNVQHNSIEEVLARNASSFFIPPFQRAYAWGIPEIDRFFDDIKTIIESERDSDIQDKQEHFFGVLVFRNENYGFESRQIVVDGQQRLTTTLLLLIALRDFEKSEENRNTIENKYIRNSSSSFEEKIKLKQVTNDWAAYKALVQKQGSIPSKITSGYNRFRTLIESVDYSTKEYIVALQRFNVAYIFLDERPYKGEDPQIIFETLNSLGKPLSLADLIRNYILLGLPSDEQTSVFENQWHSKIESRLNDHTSNFFRDYLQYKEHRSHKIVSDNNTKELYALFKAYINREFSNDKKSFISDISRYIEWYVWIIGGESTQQISNIADNDKVIRNLLRNIFFDIKADSFKPFILKLLEYHQYGFDNERMTDTSLIESLNVIRTYLIRRRVLKLTQGENKEIPKLIEEIAKNNSLISGAETEMFRLLSSGIYRLRMPNDLEITDELKRIDFYNGMRKYSKFILGIIEEKQSKVAVDYKDSRITIEHVMPQKIIQSWKTELGDNWEDVHRTFLNNIGNLILTEFNGEMGNKPLAQKQEHLKKSNLSFRNDVIGHSWKEKDIRAQQTKMIKRFLKAFPLPKEMKNASNWNSATGEQEDNDAVVPSESDAGQRVTGRKPAGIRINDEFLEADDWQTVYLTFLRYFKNSDSLTFGRLIDQTEGDFVGTRGALKGEPLIASAVLIKRIVENKPKLADSYKSLESEVLFSKAEDTLDPRHIFVYVHAQAKALVQNIATCIDFANLPEDSVSIELKPPTADSTNHLTEDEASEDY